MVEPVQGSKLARLGRRPAGSRWKRAAGTVVFIGNPPINIYIPVENSSASYFLDAGRQFIGYFDPSRESVAKSFDFLITDESYAACMNRWKLRNISAAQYELIEGDSYKIILQNLERE